MKANSNEYTPEEVLAILEISLKRKMTDSERAVIDDSMKNEDKREILFKMVSDLESMD
ncbi:hypothetical protein LCL95_00490 [Bacillus timonensis]|nr:hypothetical protein [Bacillus timonensis]